MSMNRAVIWRCTSEGVRASSTACSRAASCWAAKDWVSERNCAGARLEAASGAAGLFGGHVAGGAHHHAGAGQVAWRIAHPGDAEVGHEDVALPVDHDVGG